MSHLCSSLEDSVLKKESKTTLTLFLVCLSFLIFNVPFTILETLEDAEITSLGASYIRLLMYFLYWFQYSFNFFLYAAACEQYRRAYIYFIKCIYFAVNLLLRKWLEILMIYEFPIHLQVKNKLLGQTYSQPINIALLIPVRYIFCCIENT